jgi:hypothetical protein
MKLLKPLSVTFLLLSIVVFANAQYLNSASIQFNALDSVVPSKQESKIPAEKNRLQFKLLIIPTAMIAYGAFTMGSHTKNNINGKIQNSIWTNNPHKLNHADTYLMFAPAVSVYALNAFGIKEKNNFRDRTMIYLMSNIFVNGIIYPTKKLTHQLRPDGSNYNSFPSGHVAEAFASAEFMRMEYKDISPWYGVAGYVMAATTGYLRMYNNKHWFSDVVAGAGIGILSTKLAYWLYPKIQHSLFKDKHPNTVVMPVYKNNTFGVSMVHRF